jgi:AcrR family transcriptional regulator
VEKRCAVRYRDYVTESARSVTKSRLDRILDSAADLLVRWGYQRVTVEDVAKQAGIGKGTVYLHFRTKESLFLAVLLRVQQAVGAGMVERMRADPRHALPSRMISAVYRALAEDPVTHRIYFGDADTLGRLAHEAAETLGELSARRDAVMTEHLALLRESGLLRTELDPAAARYVLSAVSTGFFLTDSMALPAAPADLEVRARLLEHSLAAALETGGAPSRQLADRVAARYQSLIDHLDNEWRHRVR